MQAVAAYLSATLALSAGTAQGCEPMPAPAGWRDKPVQVKPDCSFTEAGHFFDYVIEGSHAQDIGGGRVGNILSDYHTCGVYEYLQVVDCNSTETAMVLAPASKAPESMVVTDFHVKESLYPPRGRMRITDRMTVPQIAAQARGHGYELADMGARLARMKPHNRYNPYCGCALFYPDSEGAALAARRP